MREFALIDLVAQMPYLPTFMRSWSHERLLSWLHLYGEVRTLDGEHLSGLGYNTYVFTSWTGLWTGFVLTDDGDMFVPGTSVAAWSAVDRHTGSSQE